MIILGINISHNSSACIMINGELKLAIQEERLTKIKNFTGYPKKSIDFCLKFLKKNHIKADIACLTTKHLPMLSYKVPIGHFFNIEDYKNFYGKEFYYKKLRRISTTKYLKNLFNDKRNKFNTYLNFSRYSTKDINKNINHDVMKYLKKQTKDLVDKIEVIDHHTCHAYYAFYASKINDQKKKHAIITLDSWGDGRNQTVFIKDTNNQLKLVAESKQCDIARIYKFVTLILSMKPDEHEFKVMGLAPYSKFNYAYTIYKDVFEGLLVVKDCKISFKKRPKDIFEYLTTKLNRYRFDSIAAAVQIFVEKLVSELFYQVYKKYKVTSFCLSGGVSMNIKMNKILSELNFVKELYVPPSGGDESLCIGGCYYLEKKRLPLNNIYLGQSISNTNLNDLKNIFKRNYLIKKNIKHTYIASLLLKGEIVGLARDREEFGARALGNRSILANPSITNSVEKINETIKSRDFWMPFALTILERKHKFFIKNKKNLDSSFMTIGFNTIEKNYYKIKAGTHPYDKTVRPQILRKSANLQFYNLIKEFEKISGIPAILNTSLNLHGLPIASSLKDIFNVIDSSSLKYLYINDKYLIIKKKQNKLF